MTQQLHVEHTFADLLTPPDGKLYELVRGQLVEKPMAAIAIWVAYRIAQLVGNHIDRTGDGWITTELPINCFPWLRNHGRRPDVSYFHFARHPGPSTKPVTAAPNFAVEVLSPNDDVISLDVKVEEYFRAGVELVWMVNPETRTVRAQRPDGWSHVFHEDASIDLAPVLPDLRLAVREFVCGPRDPRRASE